MLKLQFNVIPEDQRDPSVKRDLTDDPDARAALLSWALAGCLDWLGRGGGRKGLAPPNAVETATAAYRIKQDTLAEWWEDLLTTHSLSRDGFTFSTELRKNYEDWCEANGASPVFSQRFANYLVGKGLVNQRTNKARGWRGIEKQIIKTDPSSQLECPY